MDNKLFVTIFPIAFLAPIITFGQQQKIVISEAFEPATVRPASQTQSSNPVTGASQKPDNTPIRLQDMALPADSSVHRDQNGTLHIRSASILYISSSGEWGSDKQPVKPQAK